MNNQTLYEKVLELVKETKNRSEIVKFGISELNNNTKDRCDKAVEEKIENVEVARLKYQKEVENYEKLALEANSGKSRLKKFETRLNEVKEIGDSLKRKEGELKSEPAISLDKQKDVDEIRLKLKLLKKVTGVRFDYKEGNDVVSGYVGVPGLNVIPFTVPKDHPNVTKEIWTCVGEACDET